MADYTYYKGDGQDATTDQYHRVSGPQHRIELHIRANYWVRAPWDGAFDQGFLNGRQEIPAADVPDHILKAPRDPR
jgi:hypothetical protein